MTATATQTTPRLRLVTAETIAAGDDSQAGQTLGEFFEGFYLPNVAIALRGNSPATIQLYRDALRHWAELTVDPPLEAIDPATLFDFAAQLAQRVATSTARKHLANLNRIFARAGGGFGTVAGLLETPPRFELPATPGHTVAGDFTPQEIADLIAAASRMRSPRGIPGAPPPAEFWGSFVAVAYLHGFRVGTMLQLAREDIVDGLWQIPADKVKGRKTPLVRHVHSQAAELLADRPAGLLWPWHSGKHAARYFRRQWQRLCRLAQLPEGRRFGTHALRRAHATALAEANPEHARLSLGHSLFATTASHYINARVTAAAGAGLELPRHDADN